MQTEALIPTTADEPEGPGLSDITPVLDVVYVAGPPVVFIAAPWLLFGLVLAAPFAVALALTAVFVAAALAVVLVAALIAAPIMLVRHLHERRPALPRPAAPTIKLSAPRLWPAGV